MELKHILFAVFVISFALGIRSLAIAFENDAINGAGVLVTCFLSSFGWVILNTNRWFAWFAGCFVAFAMCTIGTIERAYMNPQLEYLWRDPIQAPYATDPEIGMLVTFAVTLFSTIVSGVGVGAGVLGVKFNKAFTVYISD